MLRGSRKGSAGLGSSVAVFLGLVLPWSGQAAGWGDASGLERLSPVLVYEVPDVRLFDVQPLPERHSDAAIPYARQRPLPGSANVLNALNPCQGASLGLQSGGRQGGMQVGQSDRCLGGRVVVQRAKYATLHGLSWESSSLSSAVGTTSPRPVRSSQVEGQLGLQTEGMARWVFRGADGPDLVFGALPGIGLALSGSAPIAGLRLQQGRMDASVLAQGDFGFSSAVGWLDFSPWETGAGAVDYGVSAGQTAVRYGWRPDVTLEGQVQTAARLRNVGLGGIYAMGEWGRLRAGATHSRYENVAGARYNLGYSVDVFDWLQVGYRAEYAMTGYSDLSRYASGPLSQPRIQGTLETGVPLAQWGTLSGTYSDIRYGNTTVQRMGLAHSLDLRRHVRLKWEANRDIVSGDYGMRINLSLPMTLLGQ